MISLAFSWKCVLLLNNTPYLDWVIEGQNEEVSELCIESRSGFYGDLTNFVYETIEKPSEVKT